MKVAMVEKANVLLVREVPDPQIGEYDALCKMLYGATCTGTDQHIIAGRFPWQINYPTILGHESVGRVMEVGKRVRYFKKGDLVTRVGALRSSKGDFDVNWGGFAEYGIARDHWAMKEDTRPKEDWDGFRVNQVVPEGIPPAAATMIITWRETLSYLTRAGFVSGMRLLVLGSGGNGLSFVAHATHMGASRIAMVGSPVRKIVALKAGTTDFFDYKLQNLTERVSNVCPTGFDFIIDAVGKKGNLDKFLPVLKPRGFVGIYGIDDYGACTLNPTRARGTFTYLNAGYDEEETHDRVVGLVQAGKLDASLWLDLEHPFPLSDIHNAFEAVKSRKVVKALVQLVAMKK